MPFLTPIEGRLEQLQVVGSEEQAVENDVGAGQKCVALVGGPGSTVRFHEVARVVIKAGQYRPCADLPRVESGRILQVLPGCREQPLRRRGVELEAARVAPEAERPPDLEGVRALRVHLHRPLGVPQAGLERPVHGPWVGLDP